MSINQEFRTRYDQEMQALFAPNCSSKRKLPHNLGHVSYACSPGLGCHLLHQAPGRDASGTRYSNMDDCNKSCTHPHVAPHSIPTHLIPGSHHPAHPAHLIPGSHHPAHPAHLIPGSHHPAHPAHLIPHHPAHPAHLIPGSHRPAHLNPHRQKN